MNDAIVSDSSSHALPRYPASGPATAYTFLRHTGFILDELCAQGLLFWVGGNGRWHWRRQGTELKSTHSFWAMGEALVDAVMARYPQTFAVPFPSEKLDQDEVG